ncbi:ABC transporter permease [Ralstonia pickettii]|nr:ABC transporter permease [Ralstonia pickettii]
MHFMKHILLFIKKFYMQIWRKWLSLPFLLLLPILTMGLIAFMLVSFFYQEDQQPLQIGIVDFDQSDETELLSSLIEESSQLSSFMQINTMSEQEAKQKITADELEAYLIFPDEFTNSLYTGDSVNLSIIGNPNKPGESIMISELINSVIRQIRDSQANILTLNHYAKEIGMADEERNEFVFEQFTEHVFLTLGRETMIYDREIVNETTSSPLHYFSIGGWFILTALWLLIFYLFLTKKEQKLISKRIKLYGVTELQQITAKLFVIFTFVLPLALLTFFGVYHFLDLQLATENTIRLGIIILLHSLAFLVVLAIIELIVLQEKLRMLIQAAFTLILLLVSGAVIPTIYFPVWIEENIRYFFSAEAFSWLTEIILNQRFYADYIPLILMNAALIFVLIAISMIKERVNE